MIALVTVFVAPIILATPTPNGSSFLDAKKSRIDYTRPDIIRPRTTCGNLINLFEPYHSVLSANLLSTAPEVCVVRGVVSPEVQYIVYLPTRWNGRFYMHGNGGYAGELLDDEVGHLARLKAAQHGFVAAFTNTGHDAVSEPSGNWAHNNLQKEIDFGFRTVHLTSIVVKNLATAYYGKASRHSYFDGCLTGGLQGFSEAQRFPDDFDSILAGAPQSAWEGRVVPDSEGELEQPLILESWFRYLAFEADDSELDWRELEPERDLARMEQSMRIFNAADPDLRPFHQRGGKMIIYHGWADFGINPLQTVEYFRQVANVEGDEISEFVQLYLIPGMHHCPGGVNIDRFDLMTPLINWVEGGVVPRDLVGHESNKVSSQERAHCVPIRKLPVIAEQAVSMPMKTLNVLTLNNRNIRPLLTSA